MRVGEAKPRDVGKKRVRVGPEAMDYLKITPGNVVEITGKRSSCAVVWPADEDEKYPDMIRIDGQTRKNVGATLNDIVKIRKVATKSAKSVVLMPVNDVVTVDKEFTDFVKNRLKGLPLSQGDEISVMILGNSMDFKINKITPRAVVKIDRSTTLNILTETAVDRKVRVTYEEVGGLREEIKAMREIVELPLRHPEVFNRLGIEPHSGILLYGPPGCGKTLIAKVLASESEANMYSINGPEIMNKYYGETEARLRDIFKEAKDNSPSIIFIDEIDAIAPKREEAYGDVEKRVVAQLLALMDGLTDRGNVIVLGATNRADMIDPALLRPGRFDKIIQIPLPDKESRKSILKINAEKIPTVSDEKDPQHIDFEKLSELTDGLSGADTASIANTAVSLVIHEFLDSHPDVKDIEKSDVDAKVTMKHFEEAVKKVREQKDLKLGEKLVASYYR
ncbi:MAG: AAA family ATPase [Nitrosopumilaceae archaeon]